jgi:putative PIN family toxin of toxin-antitoxin system
MQRVVLDTNVFVSGLLTREGAAAQALNAWREREFILLVSEGIIAEFQSTLSYDRIRDKYGIITEDIHHLNELLRQDAILVPGEIILDGALPDDPKDEMFLSCALASDADAIVSGDKHLLGLGEYEVIPILTLRKFLDRLGD